MVDGHLEDGEDTRLARELNARGIVSTEQLSQCLQEVRQRRASGINVPLAGLLLERRLVDAGALQSVGSGGHTSPAGGPHFEGTGAAGVGAGVASGTVPTLPRQLGNYRLGRRLGSGGMGAVYEATHVVTEQIYALKVIDLTLLATDDGESRERFRREGLLGSRLDHPNIVSVVDADLSGAIPYIVQELLPGETLSELLRRVGTLPWREALELLIPIAEALGHAHSCGILHRDLKPANILFDGQGRLCLADFGLARETGGQALRLTLSGEALGTPNYMAPEQATGARAQEASLDVYGLCAVLFQVMVGEPPFVAPTLIQVLERVVHQPAPVLSSRADVPPELDAILKSGLAKDPSDRYQTGSELAAVLRDCLDLSTAPPASRGRLGWASVGVSLLALSGLAGLGVWVASSDRPSPTLASVPPVPTATPRPTIPEAPLDPLALGGPKGWALAWELSRGSVTPEEPVLWEVPGRVADPLGALERPGGAEAAFSGDPERVGPGVWSVRYAPRRGLVLIVGRHAGYLIQPLMRNRVLVAEAPFRWLGPWPEGAAPGTTRVGVPNDGGALFVHAGRGRWASPRVEARFSIELIDRGYVSLRDGSGFVIAYSARAKTLKGGGAAVAKVDWEGVLALRIDATAARNRVTLGGRSFDGLAEGQAVASAPKTAPWLGLAEGWFEVEWIRVEGRPLQPDRAALARVEGDLQPSTQFAWGVRYRSGGGLGGPCLDLGEGSDRLRLSVEGSSLRLLRGDQVLRRVTLPAPTHEGVLSLVRRGDLLEARLVSGERTWSFVCATPFPIRPGWSYGSTGPRVEILDAALALGPSAEERARHDAGEGPSETPLGTWRATVVELEKILDPLQINHRLRGRAGARARSSALAGLALRLVLISPDLPLEIRRDALARALVARAYAGDRLGAKAVGVALAAEGAVAGLDVVAWLDGGRLAEQLKSGLQVQAQAPRISLAGAEGVLPLLPKSVRAEVDYTVCNSEKILIENELRRRRMTPADRISIEDLAASLELIRATGYSGRSGREVLVDLCWCYEILGEFALYKARAEDLLNTSAGASFSWAWIGYGEQLGLAGEFGPGAEAMLGGLVRELGNPGISSRCAYWLRVAGANCPPASRAVLNWGIAQAGGANSQQAERAALEETLVALASTQTSARDQDLAAIVLFRLTGKPPRGFQPSATPLGRFLGWLLSGELPPLAALRAAIREDRLVEHLALFDQRLSPLVGK